MRNKNKHFKIIGSSILLFLLIALLTTTLSPNITTAQVWDEPVPNYFGPYPNFATSQLPTVTRDPTTGEVLSADGGIRKFIDSLPLLGPEGTNNLNQYLPVAISDTTTYPGCDYYEIALVEFTQKMHTDIAPTTLRGYVQLETSANYEQSQHYPLSYPDGSPILKADNTQAICVDQPRYLGPFIVAQKDMPVRIKFTNFLPTGEAGDLFLPVDTTVMGSGMGSIPMQNPDGSPMRNPDGMIMYESYTENRATLHLHGGNTPWISDGTPHQWITPSGEDTVYPKGVSVQYVPDMWFVDGEVIPNTIGQTTPPVAGASNNPGGDSMTFYYTNQQSARLLFYHDHAYGITRLNVYAGEAAGYIIRDQVEQALISQGLIPQDEIPLVLQDKTFVPDTTTPITNMWGTFDSQIAFQDPTWNTLRWGDTGSLWYPHVYMTMQNPGDTSGMNTFGRWHYAPWFWPPYTPEHPPVANPYMGQVHHGITEPALIPGVPNVSAPGEAFLDTPVINGVAYPYLDVKPQAYRFRILNAADDRGWNLQFYVADSTVTTIDGRNNTEVRMVPAVPTPGFPDTWPTDGRDGGVPDPTTAGPAFIQIGNEAGLLPTPAVLENKPVNWNWDMGTFDFGNINQNTLALAAAERADVIVDFSQFAGQTLILYNDNPAPNPAPDPRLDYYTDNPDQTDSGGAPSTIAGYGPNTRTIMQIRVADTTPATEYNTTTLNNAFASTSTTEGAYAAAQRAPIVPQAAYTSAFNQTFSDVYGTIYDNSLIFTPINATDPVTMSFQAKSIHDEMGGTYDVEYGRMQVQLGVEQTKSTPLTQTTILYGFADPSTEIIVPGIEAAPIGSLSDGTQIWRITHNGVDQHPMHWHMYDVQLINRVAWDNNIRPPDPNELGWKDTIRVNPLQDTYIALRPIVPDLPFDLPNSVRLLDPTMPEGEVLKTTGFIMDPTGQAITLTNHVVNFGWEYVWHCHILAHEEMDAMRAVSVAVPPVAPTNLIITPTESGISLTWTDNSLGETGFTIQRSEDSQFTTGLTSFTVAQNSSNYIDNSTVTDTTYYYRVIANNLVGDTFDYTITNPNAKGFQTVMVNSTASNTASTDQLYNIIRGPNDEILYSTYNFDTAQWSDLMALPSGATIDTPTATTIGGQLYIAVRGTDGSSIWFSSVNIADNSFSGWTNIPGGTPSAPTLTTNGQTLTLVVRGFNNLIYYKTYDPMTTTWSNWSSVANAATSDKIAAAMINDTMHLIVKGMTPNANLLWYASVNISSNTVSTWTLVQGTSPSAASLTADQATNRLFLVA